MAQLISSGLWAAPLLAFESPEVRRAARLGAKEPENTRCANCQEPNPEYVCMDFRTFVCAQCSEAHLEFGHSTMAIADPEWEDAAIERVAERGGNQRAAARWLAFWDAGDFARPQRDDHERRREFIRKAYVVKCWHRQPKARRPRARPAPGRSAASSGAAPPQGGCAATSSGSECDQAWVAEFQAPAGASSAAPAAAAPAAAEAEAPAARGVSPYRRTCKRTGAVEYPPWLTDAVASPESPRPAGAAAAAEGGPSCECPAPSAAVPEAQPEDAPSPRSAAAASGGAAPERPRTPRTRPHWRGPAGAGEEQPPACAGSCGSAGGGGAAARSRAAPPDRFSALGDVDGALQEYERPAEFGELLQAFHEGARAWAPQRPPGAAPGAVEASAAAPPAGAGRDSSAEGAAFGWL